MKGFQRFFYTSRSSEHNLLEEVRKNQLYERHLRTLQHIIQSPKNREHARSLQLEYNFTKKNRLRAIKVSKQFQLSQREKQISHEQLLIKRRLSSVQGLIKTTFRSKPRTLKFSLREREVKFEKERIAQQNKKFVLRLKGRDRQKIKAKVIRLTHREERRSPSTITQKLKRFYSLQAKRK